ncbi:MAG: preprotein translocase subunit SecG [Eubacteriales bacterium]|nr:preprotein translocase subunit SecG [Eubacteriales bacterium]
MNVLHIVISLAIIVIVLMQSSKQSGLGSIAGGAETFFGKNKGRTIDAMLSKYTSVGAIAYLITSILLYVLIKNQ